jgi:hypothetical protein
VVIVTIPEAKIRDLPKNLFEGVPGDVVVIDTGNYYPRERDGRIDEIEAGMPESRWVGTQLGRPVVKAFNTMNYKHLLELGRPPGTPGRAWLYPLLAMTPGRNNWCCSWLTNSDLTESTTAGWTIPGASSRARQFMTRNWTAPMCGTHWPKRERSACLSGRQQAAVQAASLNVPERRTARTKGTAFARCWICSLIIEARPFYRFAS